MSVSSQNVLVLGCSGMLGSYLLSGNYLRRYKCYGQSRGVESDVQVDLENTIQVREMLAQTRPAVIINLVGLTNVDFCEQHPNEAYRVNVRTLQNVLEAVQLLPYKPRLIHISTDQVYDGLGPHRECSVTLTNYYAFSKYTAELVAVAESGLVLRTNFFGKSQTEKRKSLTDWLNQELVAERDIQVFEDVQFSPLSMHTLCGVIESAIESNVQGVFNLGSHSGMSKADFAFQFAKCLDLPTARMSRVTTKDVDFLKTYRPIDMRLNVSALEKAMNIKLPTLSAEIVLASKEYRV